MMSSELLNESLHKLDIDHFTDERNKLLFEAIADIALNTTGQPTAQRVYSWISSKPSKCKNKDSLISYITDVVDSFITSANHIYFCNILEEKKKQRELITNYWSAFDTVMDSETDSNQKMSAIENILDSVRHTKTYTSITHIKDVCDAVLEALEKKSQIVETGFYNMDRFLGGFKNGELIILAARPSMGKSSFMMNLAYRMALKGQAVYILSLEMSKDGLTQRIISQVSGVELSSIVNRTFDEEGYGLICKASYDIGNLPLYIDDDCITSPGHLRLKLKSVKSKKDIKCVFIDYLQLMSGERFGNDRQNEVSFISRQLKLLAKEFELPIFCLSQLSRKPEDRENHRPRLSDLRDSGSIEQDADMVLFLYRDGHYKKIEDPDHLDDGHTDLIVAKNRQGAIGNIELLWMPEQVSFIETFERNFNDSKDETNQENSQKTSKDSPKINEETIYSQTA